MEDMESMLQDTNILQKHKENPEKTIPVHNRQYYIISKAYMYIYIPVHNRQDYIISKTYMYPTNR